jgi:hypothetical protein
VHLPLEFVDMAESLGIRVASEKHLHKIVWDALSAPSPGETRCAA